MEIAPVQTALWSLPEKLVNIRDEIGNSDEELERARLTSETLFPVYEPVEKVRRIQERVDVYV